jgi:hypothetical protein
LPVSFLCSRLILWSRRNRLQRRLEETIGEDVATGIQEIVSPTIEPSVVTINVPVVVTKTITRTATRTTIRAVSRIITRAVLRIIVRAVTRTIVSLITRVKAPGPLGQIIGEIETLMTAENPIVETVTNKIGLNDLGTKLNRQEHRNRINSRLEKRVTIKGIRAIASVVNKNVVVSLLNQRTLNSLINKNSHLNQLQPKQLQPKQH